MIRVVKILDIQQEYIDCELNNGTKKRITLHPLLEKHSNFKGIEQFQNLQFLKNAEIGAFGEIFWKDAVFTSTNEKWNYDISPEFIYFHGASI